jgi:hypothetical protein
MGLKGTVGRQREAPEPRHQRETPGPRRVIVIIFLLTRNTDSALA